MLLNSSHHRSQYGEVTSVCPHVMSMLPLVGSASNDCFEDAHADDERYRIHEKKAKGPKKCHGIQTSGEGNTI